jgi:hypothetical protein
MAKLTNPMKRKTIIKTILIIIIIWLGIDAANDINQVLR